MSLYWRGIVMVEMMGYGADLAGQGRRIPLQRQLRAGWRSVTGNALGGWPPKSPAMQEDASFWECHSPRPEGVPLHNTSTATKESPSCHINYSHAWVVLRPQSLDSLNQLLPSLRNSYGCAVKSLKGDWMETTKTQTQNMSSSEQRLEMVSNFTPRRASFFIWQSVGPASLECLQSRSLNYSNLQHRPHFNRPLSAS